MDDEISSLRWEHCFVVSDAPGVQCRDHHRQHVSSEAWTELLTWTGQRPQRRLSQPHRLKPQPPLGFFKNEQKRPAGVAQWLSVDPAPGQGTCPGCGPDPQWGACRRRPVDILSHPCFFPSVSLSLPLSKINKERKKTNEQNVAAHTRFPRSPERCGGPPTGRSATRS
uniref:Uncharacterized protein n=1 Tax=Molossus molossus TaxID=27622 RepID=A0A7J8GQS8_MOLMO|nr:hypothetical protein HJG59_011394 [Molossus molossus]